MATIQRGARLCFLMPKKKHIITLTKQPTISSSGPAPKGDGDPDINLEPCAVSRAMREAGAVVLQEWRGVLDSESLAEHVYRAMASKL